MSRVHSTFCPSQDPWRIGCRRILRTGPTEAPNEKPTVKFLLRARKGRQRTQGSPDFQIASGFSHLPSDFTTEQDSSLLRKESFVKKRASNTAFAKPILPSTPAQLHPENIVADLVEQISELTGIIEQLLRDHETTRKQLEKEMKEKHIELQGEHDAKVRQIETFHKAEMTALEEQYKKELRTERATAQQKLDGMQKEYKYLKNAFRVYQDSISDEMEEKWLRRQAEWKKSERTEREKALLQQKQSLTKKFEKEMEEQKLLIQKNSFLVDIAFQQEREDFRRQLDEKMEKIEILTQKIDALEQELKEKNETLNEIASTLHRTEMELKREKSAVAELEKTILQRIAIVEDKHRRNTTYLMEENTTLRRKVMEKNEELLNERTQRNNYF